MKKRTFGMRSLVVCGMIATLAALPVSVFADDAGQLLAKHKAYVGWSMGDGSITSLHLRGTEVLTHKDGTHTDIASLDELRQGFFYRLSSTFLKSGNQSVAGLGQATGGVRFWTSTSNGFTVPNLSDDRGEILARRVVFAEGNAGLPAVVRPSETVDGAQLSVVRQTPPSGKPFDLYIDAATGAYKRLVYDPDGGAKASTIVFDAYADVLHGKKVVSQWHFAGSPFTIRYDSIAANVPLSADALQPPPPQARWTFGRAAASIPVQVRKERITVRATVNGVGGMFILDTGAADIAFTDAFADRAGLKRGQSYVISGIASDQARKVRGARVRVDSLAFADGSALHNVDAMSGMQPFTSEPEIDGLLGFDFLGGAIVDLDMDKSSITLYDPKTNTADERSGVVLVPDLSSGQPVVPVTFDGRASSNALLDMGAAAPVLIPRRLVGKLNVLAMQQMAIGGVTGGYEVDECGVLSNIQIGAIVWQNAGACFSSSVDTSESIIGFDFLRNFNITFDYPDGKMIFAKRPSVR